MCSRTTAACSRVCAFRNVLFKFVHNVASVRDRMYESDYAGAKAASLELKGALYIEYANVLGLTCPIHCVVDYAGCRVLAKAWIECGADSLVYGSSDGGITVFAEPTTSALMKVVC